MRQRIENMLKDLRAFEGGYPATSRKLSIATPAEVIETARGITSQIVGPRLEEGESVKEWCGKAETRLLNLQFAMAMRDALETGGGLTWARSLH